MNFSQEYIIELLYKYRKGTLNTVEKKELIEFYNTNNSNKQLVNKYYKLYVDARSIAFAQHIDTEKAWSNISKKINQNKNSLRKLYAWSLSAAAIVFLVGVSLFFMLQQTNKAIKNNHYASIAPVGKPQAVLTLSNGEKIDLENFKSQWQKYDTGAQIIKDSNNNISYKTVKTQKKKLIYNTITIPRGGEYNLTLSDGTIVKLNAESQLRYPVNFGKNSRDVYLSGEGYFDVAHNKKSPFTVHISDTKIKVLGTKFNVSGYANEEVIATTLVQGSVAVNVLGKTKLLKPGYQSKVIRGQNNITINKVDTNLYTSWTTGVYEFDNTCLEQIMAQLGRWYNVKFFFGNNQLKNIRFTGAVKRNKPIDYALDMLERIANVKFKIKDNYIVVDKI